MGRMAGSPQGAISQILRGFVAALALLALGACTSPLAIALTGASAATYVATGKTIPGHAMSYVTDQDSLVMRNLLGEPMCRDLPAAGGVEEQVVEMACYRSIADITCYRAENPHETVTRRLH